MGTNKKKANKGKSTPETIDDYILGLYEAYAPKDTNQSSSSNRFKILEQNSAIWPGSILSGTNLQLGHIHEYALERAPIKLISSATKKVDRVQSPTDSTVADALVTLEQFPSTAPIHTTYSINESEYLQYFDAELKFAGDTLTSEFSATGNLTLSSGQSYLLYKLDLEVFNISVETIRDASDFFTSEETVTALKTTMLPDDYPIVIDSVTYGRSLYLLILTKYDEKTFNAALNFIYDSVKNGVSVSLDSAYVKMIEESTIFSSSVGLSGEDTAGQVHSAEDLVGAFQSVVKPKEQTAIPISFETAKLTNSMAPIVVPTGFIELKLTEIQAEAATAPPHGNYKVFGEVYVDYSEYASSKQAKLFLDSNLTSDPSSAGDFWVELKEKGDKGTIESSINKTCKLSYNGGNIVLYADIWDHFTGSSNEMINKKSITRSTSSILNDIQALKEGELLTIPVTATSSEWGSVTINYIFDFDIIA